MLRKLLYWITMLAYGKEAKMIVEKNPKEKISPPHSVFELGFRSLAGKEISMNQFRGKKILIVNTASNCGYTPQFKELQMLQDRFKDKLEILGFPANNFNEQEPLDNEGIGEFCERNYGVDFLIAEKTDVLGKNTNPLFRWLSDPKMNGWNKRPPAWNFTKFLISENGELLAYFPAAISPLSEEITGLI